jgi:hypothetical protein
MRRFWVIASLSLAVVLVPGGVAAAAEVPSFPKAQRLCEQQSGQFLLDFTAKGYDCLFPTPEDFALVPSRSVAKAERICRKGYDGSLDGGAFFGRGYRCIGTNLFPS